MLVCVSLSDRQTEGEREEVKRGGGVRERERERTECILYVQVYCICKCGNICVYLQDQSVCSRHQKPLNASGLVCLSAQNVLSFLRFTLF